jgi:hypothetical protein
MPLGWARAWGPWAGGSGRLWCLRCFYKTMTACEGFTSAGHRSATTTGAYRGCGLHRLLTWPARPTGQALGPGRSQTRRRMNEAGRPAVRQLMTRRRELVQPSGASAHDATLARVRHSGRCVSASGRSLAAGPVLAGRRARQGQPGVRFPTAGRLPHPKARFRLRSVGNRHRRGKPPQQWERQQWEARLAVPTVCPAADSAATGEPDPTIRKPHVGVVGVVDSAMVT